MFITRKPGDQVVVVPEWAFDIVAKKGRIEDITNFSKMRQWFTQEQLVALDRFSEDGLATLWNNGRLPTPQENQLYTRSIGYLWYFPSEAGESENGDTTDQYSKNQLSDLSDNREYSSRITNEYCIDYLKEDAKDKVDLTQSYSVYSGSEALILLVMKKGILSPVIFNRKEELRLTMLRSILEKLYMYYEMPVVHKTRWFEMYLIELDLNK